MKKSEMLSSLKHKDLKLQKLELRQNRIVDESNRKPAKIRNVWLIKNMLVVLLPRNILLDLEKALFNS